MKITVAFLPEETEHARLVLDAMRSILSVDKVKESANHPPFSHLYITTTKPKNRCGSKENG